MRCFAHTLNLSVQKGISAAEMGGMLTGVRKLVGFFRRSTVAASLLQVSYCSTLMSSSNPYKSQTI